MWRIQCILNKSLNVSRSWPKRRPVVRKLCDVRYREMGVEWTLRQNSIRHYVVAFLYGSAIIAYFSLRSFFLCFFFPLLSFHHVITRKKTLSSLSLFFMMDLNIASQHTNTMEKRESLCFVGTLSKSDFMAFLNWNHRHVKKN